ncbi:hypothetical protein FUAX_40780 (plasmid) [Fulvitalea axinellae]|uniref:Uncharacterized protein n=1 Tax=Fulvitalea axinellae TaxID=1182444 RepID=A0AAU9CHL2_9BACT|nr:hypothetical protein FUAX_40780 [Fulvitalea axinellae]
MALDKNKLEANIAVRIKGVDLTDKGATASLVRILAEEIAEYVRPLEEAYNGHTHGGVIVGVAGGSGSPAVGTTGNSGETTNKT